MNEIKLTQFMRKNNEQRALRPDQRRSLKCAEKGLPRRRMVNWLSVHFSHFDMLTPNGCLTARCEKWCQILGITFACASGKSGAFEELLERAFQSHGWQKITSLHAVSHLMRMGSLL